MTMTIQYLTKTMEAAMSKTNVNVRCMIEDVALVFDMEIGRAHV